MTTLDAWSDAGISASSVERSLLRKLITILGNAGGVFIAMILGITLVYAMIVITGLRIVLGKKSVARCRRYGSGVASSGRLAIRRCLISNQEKK